MSFELAIRLTEILLAIAFIQQSVEHLNATKHEQHLFIPRLLLSAALMAGLWTKWVLFATIILSLFILNRFQGPYNGGSDRMSLLVLCCLCGTHFIPEQNWQEVAFGYLALQLTLSYFIAGWVKFVNPEWRNGTALRDVFYFSIYPASESIRKFAERRQILLIMSWAVILFELLFPFALLTETTLLIALTFGAGFHLANAFLFGLNRFFWAWIAAYPSIIWLQSRLFDMGF